MKSSRITVGVLVAAIALFPAIAPAATTADLQSQMIVILRQIVTLQQQLIATLQAEVAQLQAEVNSLTGNSSYSQLWPLQQTLGTNPTPQSAQMIDVASKSSGGGSCISAEGVAVPSGYTIQHAPPTCLPGGVCFQTQVQVKTLKCDNGQWFWGGVLMPAPPYLR